MVGFPQAGPAGAAATPQDHEQGSDPTANGDLVVVVPPRAGDLIAETAAAIPLDAYDSHDIGTAE